MEATPSQRNASPFQAVVVLMKRTFVAPVTRAVLPTSPNRRSAAEAGDAAAVDDEGSVDMAARVQNWLQFWCQEFQYRKCKEQCARQYALVEAAAGKFCMTCSQSQVPKRRERDRREVAAEYEGRNLLPNTFAPSLLEGPCWAPQGSESLNAPSGNGIRGLSTLYSG